ncbi:MAG: acyl-CoA dehydrogenase family protein [Actinomycetota bacterium]|nr:acyl-CoA dehydrogenase family protein [Actinomycetota bacterium]MDD5666173.1 acyl-CoA dehydrogenase family protein [Actinomycetota bacterium]
MAQVSIERKENRFVQELLSPSDKLLLSSTRDFVDEQIMPVRRELDESTRSDYGLVEETLKKMLPLGLQGGFLPEEYGGMGLSSALTTALLAEEMGRGDAALFTSLMGGILAMRPAIKTDNREVLEHFAPRFVQEDELCLGCFAATEPQGGSDIENADLMGSGITCAAALRDGQWVMDGTKVWSVNAGLAGAYCVVASTDQSLGDEGIALVYVEVPTQGFTFLGFEDKEGLRGSRQGGFELKGVRVPEGWRAAGPGWDAELLWDNQAFARIVSAGLAIGMAQGTLDEVLAFTTDRIAAGKPIRQHTVCATMLADIAMGIQAGRDNYVNAAYLYDRPEVYGDGASVHMLSRASAAKVFCCDAAINVTNRAMELMGSYGYVTDYYVEKYWRDAKTLQLWEGGAQLSRLDVVRGYYDFDQFHRNELYERIREIS